MGAVDVIFLRPKSIITEAVEACGHGDRQAEQRQRRQAGIARPMGGDSNGAVRLIAVGHRGLHAAIRQGKAIIGPGIAVGIGSLLLVEASAPPAAEFEAEASTPVIVGRRAPEDRQGWPFQEFDARRIDQRYRSAKAPAEQGAAVAIGNAEIIAAFGAGEGRETGLGFRLPRSRHAHQTPLRGQPVPRRGHGVRAGSIAGHIRPAAA